MKSKKLYYGIDPDGHGFFWPTSPSKRKEYFEAKRNDPATTEAVYQCNPGRLQGDIFKEEDFAYYEAPVHRALGYSACHKFLISKGEIIVQSWDTAFSSDDKSDPSACITALLAPCDKDHFTQEEIDPHYDIYILDAFAQRLDFGDLEEYAKAQANLWKPNYILIEKKASGEPLIQNLKKEGLPVEAVPDSKLGKRARAMMGTSAGSAQGWMRSHRVYFPVRYNTENTTEVDPPIAKLIVELKNFSGVTGGRDDQVDAFVHLVNWAIMRFVQTGALPDNLEEMAPVPDFPTPQQQLAAIGMMESENPYAETCQNCKYFDDVKKFCGFHKQTTVALNFCEFFTPENDEEFMFLFSGIDSNE